jgi:hypothetical protein
MLLSELFIIYFAAAAPFGVSRFLSEHANGARTRPALRKAVLAALAWPVTSLQTLLGRAASRGNARADVESDALDSRAVEQATRATVNALRAVEDLLACADKSLNPESRHAFFNARECVERYSGLALACASTDAGASPSPREMELCRIAGRAGDDLLVAGRCVHRRNAARLFAHRERARAELVRALACVRALADDIYAARQTSGCAAQSNGNGAGRLPSMLPSALKSALASVVKLASLFDDAATKDELSRLLDERGRAGQAEPRAEFAPGADSREGEEPCTTPAVPTAFVTRRLRTTTSQGG